ncbi:unnamed protein product [Caenorhabditis bovis]|uniref:Uncharacterized protein n=1 Tax=Caenorhabditis bovis TaxID=2654633 RepID=A0A8S1FFB3_9PELO|nr:unnamed protein product [Caenorhabditis bovis]
MNCNLNRTWYYKIHMWELDSITPDDYLGQTNGSSYAPYKEQIVKVAIYEEEYFSRGLDFKYVIKHSCNELGFTTWVEETINETCGKGLECVFWGDFFFDSKLGQISQPKEPDWQQLNRTLL